MIRKKARSESDVTRKPSNESRACYRYYCVTEPCWAKGSGN